MEVRKEDNKMKKLKRKLIGLIIIVVLMLIFARSLTKDLNRMNNNLKQQNSIEKSIELDNDN